MSSESLNAIKRIDTTSLVDKVENSLVDFLKEKNLKIGDSIPKELDLALALGVSRTVIREALTRLRLMGLIETKKKSGSFITSPDLFGIMSKSMDPHILDLDTLKEIFEIDYDKSVDKSETLGIDKVGYRSIHFIAKLKADRLKLPEYKKFKGLCFEIQIRTILQHAWAEIEHDKDYKFSGELPIHLKRRFKVLAGVLELADREFNNIATEIDDYSQLVKLEAMKGDLNIEINSASTKSYIDYRFADLIEKEMLNTERMVSRDLIQEIKAMGISNLEELNAKIPNDLNKKVVQFINGKENYSGFLRTILMIIDIDKYFTKAWQNKWQGIDHSTVTLLKAYNIDIFPYLKKFKMQILGQANIR